MQNFRFNKNWKKKRHTDYIFFSKTETIKLSYPAKKERHITNCLQSLAHLRYKLKKKKKPDFKMKVYH